MQKHRLRALRRLAYCSLVATVAAVGLAVTSFQMESAFGRAVACQLAAPYWLADPAPAVEPPPDTPQLRTVTYNLHSGLGSEWQSSAPRDYVERNLRAIARRIAAAGTAAQPVDVVGLNEVDFGSRRSGGFDQAVFLADELKALTRAHYEVVEGETWRRTTPGEEVRFGNALLVRHRVLSQNACWLAQNCSGVRQNVRVADWPARLLAERRGVVRAQVDFYGRPLDILVTHLEAMSLAQREAEAAELTRHLVRPGVATIVLGDVNAVSSWETRGRSFFAADRTHDILTSGLLLDARVALAARRRATDLSAWATYPAAAPRWPLDGIFATAELAPVSAEVIGGRESDHRGLLVRYGWLGETAAAKQGYWHAATRREQLAQILACDFPQSDERDRGRFAALIASTGFFDDIGLIAERLGFVPEPRDPAVRSAYTP